MSDHIHNIMRALLCNNESATSVFMRNFNAVSFICFRVHVGPAAKKQFLLLLSLLLLLLLLLFLRRGYSDFWMFSILKHILLNLHIIIGLL